MRAAVNRSYGPPEVVHVEDVATVQPGRGEVRVRVIATPVTRGDTLQRAAAFPPGMGAIGRMMLGMRRPRHPVLGTVFAGVITDLGPGADGLAIGDRVSGVNGLEAGAHAEYVVAKASACTPIPDGVTARDAAATLFGGTTAVYFLDRGRLRPGARVLVNGASGEVGLMALQIARGRGASVTGVTSAANAPLLGRLGADELVDYTLEPLSQHRQRYDLVLDTVGNLGPRDVNRLLTDDGRLVLLRATLPQMLAPGRRTVTGSSLGRSDGAAELLRSVEDGTLTPVIDDMLPLDQVVVAHRRVDSLRKVGSVVLAIADDDGP
ncbi:NAD(P)-dependent alcohol dehydrogenase [Streptomyces sp. NPDC002766]|uniref:NAD(P)-dependent alcohol dehydrogenase n=1 Tax=unclassified Streptomyces TaxID=2593676 RepID=UPI0033330FFA